MKAFSPAWKSSSRGGKQRKYRLNAPLHIKNKFLAAAASAELRSRLGAKSIAVREGDMVKVAKGEFRGITGSVNSVILKEGVVYVDGAERARKDGTKSFFPMRPASLLVVDVKVEDKRRAAAISREPAANKSEMKEKGKK